MNDASVKQRGRWERNYIRGNTSTDGNRVQCVMLDVLCISTEEPAKGVLLTFCGPGGAILLHPPRFQNEDEMSSAVQESSHSGHG